MELLSELPAILDETHSDADFAARLVELLMEGIPASDAVAVVQYDMPDMPDMPDDDGVATMVWRPSPVLPYCPRNLR